MVPLFYICPLQLINLRSSSFQNMVHSHRRTCSCLFINNHQREGRHERNKQMQLRWHPAWWLSPRQSLPWTWQYSLINVTIIIALMLVTLTIKMWGATHVGQFFFTLAQLPPAFHFKVTKLIFLFVLLETLSSQASHIHKSGHRAIAQRPNNWPFIEISRDDASLH